MSYKFLNERAVGDGHVSQRNQGCMILFSIFVDNMSDINFLLL